MGPLLKIHDSAALRGRLMRMCFNRYKESHKGLYSQSSPQEEVLRYFNKPFVEYLISSARVLWYQGILRRLIDLSPFD